MKKLFKDCSLFSSFTNGLRQMILIILFPCLSHYLLASLFFFLGLCVGNKVNLSTVSLRD